MRVRWPPSCFAWPLEKLNRPSDWTSDTMDNKDRTPDKTTGGHMIQLALQARAYSAILNNKQMGLDPCPLHILYGTLRNETK